MGDIGPIGTPKRPQFDSAIALPGLLGCLEPERGNLAATSCSPSYRPAGTDRGEGPLFRPPSLHVSFALSLSFYHISLPHPPALSLSLSFLYSTATSLRVALLWPASTSLYTPHPLHSFLQIPISLARNTTPHQAPTAPSQASIALTPTLSLDTCYSLLCPPLYSRAIIHTILSFLISPRHGRSSSRAHTPEQ